MRFPSLGRHSLQHSHLSIFRKKKKSKKSSKEKGDRRSAVSSSHGLDDEAASEAGPSTSTSTSNSEIPLAYRGKTKAEIAFLERKRVLDEKRIREKAQVSHKEKVEKFNDYLNNLSEHYEQAKVSWTK